MLPGLNLHPGENLHSGANCAHEQRLSLSYNYLAGSLINAMTYKCADSPEGYGAFLRLFVCSCCCFFCVFFFHVQMLRSCQDGHSLPYHTVPGQANQTVNRY